MTIAARKRTATRSFASPGLASACLPLQHAVSDESIAAYLRENPSLSENHRRALRKRTIVPGMSQPDVELLGGKQLEKRFAHVWCLADQFLELPLLEARRVYLHWHEDVVAAIIVRGAYAVFW